jgi:hypothetical protein
MKELGHLPDSFFKVLLERWKYGIHKSASIINEATEPREMFLLFVCVRTSESSATFLFLDVQLFLLLFPRGKHLTRQPFCLHARKPPHSITNTQLSKHYYTIVYLGFDALVNHTDIHTTKDDPVDSVIDHEGSGIQACVDSGSQRCRASVPHLPSEKNKNKDDWKMNVKQIPMSNGVLLLASQLSRQCCNALGYFY